MRILLASAVSAWLFSPQVQAPLPQPAAPQPISAPAPPPALRLKPVLKGPAQAASLGVPSAALGLLSGLLLAAAFPNPRPAGLRNAQLAVTGAESLCPVGTTETAPVFTAFSVHSEARTARSVRYTRRGVLAGAAAFAASSKVTPAAADDGGAAEAGRAEEAISPPPPPPPPAKTIRSMPSGLSYEVVKTGTGGGQPKIGDLIAVRFKCVVRSSGIVIDDILASSEPYYFRVGSGNVLPAVEEAVVLMKSGDVWNLTVPPTLGFGPKGRNASPGKPRIPGDAILDFTLELVAVPGKDEEILEENGIIE